MLGDIHFRLPESTPKAFWWALLVLVIIAGALIVFPSGVNSCGSLPCTCKTRKNKNAPALRGNFTMNWRNR